ncbi:glycoside hydrolase family 15 [Streptomyces sp. WAC 06738]|uniref:glycoside hydrolase family 15 protein n=1 Tax=Streptomyces sp. WAC 06738 TaxID=2203210 RepID=UPI000F713A08|nr:glycoside hydrolase family 15 protein [Streptomyces sp. WAC 06738]AZM50467.1 glycoside hydrolase family 15 [Streptomyces sp. WAC 06738]
MHRWAALLALAVVLVASQGWPRDAAAAAPAYDGQPRFDTALFSIKGPDNAAAQEFTTDDSRVEKASLYLASRAASGTVTVEVRTAREDPGSAISSSTRDLAQLGGGGAGWLDFPLGADVTPGTTYYLFAQATTTESKAIAWHGTRSPVGGSLTSWNYDLPVLGGWRAYTTRTAFFVNPAGAEGCGDPDACYRAVPDHVFAASTAGLYSNGKTTEAITPVQAYGSEYVRDSNVLRLPSGRWRYLPAGGTEPVTVHANDPGARRQISESRAWLKRGTVPGRTGPQRKAAARALLSMRALVQPNGASAAAWYSIWKYSWPRDSSYVAAALAHTGHTEDAYRILTYNASTQRPDGTWEARTTLDGAGPPDSRHWQLDANGWVPWSTWQWYQAAPRQTRDADLEKLYPAIEKAADYAAASLDGDGLPPASPDYWELGTGTPNIGTAAPLLSGLNAAADLARALGHDDHAATWAEAAGKLSAAIAERFAPLGYPRTVDGLHGRDSAAAFMAPPFNTAPADLRDALDSTYDALLRPNGGVVPGDDPGHDWGTSTWTPSTSFFGLAWAGLGEREKAGRVLDWVLSKRNVLGELPEKVDDDGNPASVVPLGWTDSLFVLTLLQLDRDDALPVPPRAR